MSLGTILDATPSARAASAATGHVASLDGLRGLAIIGVLLVHAGFPGMVMGDLGVDLFFVLSGFLITTLLVQELRRTGRVSLRKFWARRFLRLMPAFWIYAAFVTVSMFVAHWGWTSTHHGATPLEFCASIWLYYVNYMPRGGIWEHQDLTVQLWSLAVEEQFYVLWPPIFALCLGRRRPQIEWVAWGLVAAMTLPYLMPGSDYPETRLNGRGVGILMGCAIALTAARSSSLIRWVAVPAVRASILAMVLLAFLIPTALAYAHRYSPDYDRYRFPIFGLATALMVTMLWYGPRGRLSRALSWAPLAYIGKISYGIYLYHQVARLLAWDHLVHGDSLNRIATYGLRLSVYLILSLAIATLSYYALERPFLSLKSHLR